MLVLLWCLTLATEFRLRSAKIPDDMHRSNRLGPEEKRSFVRRDSREGSQAILAPKPAQLLDVKGDGVIASAVAHMSRLTRGREQVTTGTSASLLQGKANRSEPASKQSACESNLVATYMSSVDRDLKECMDKKFLLLGSYDPTSTKDKVQDIIVECFGKMFTRMKPTGNQCEALQSMLKCEETQGRVENADIAIGIEKRRMRACPKDQTCFPGEASLVLHGHARKKMLDLKVGDRVLVQQVGGQLAFEPVLGFLHVAHGGPTTSHSYLKIAHELGELHISGNHLLFVEDHTSASWRRDKLAMELKIGDSLFVVHSGGTAVVPSRVVAIHREVSELGMYAPLTAPGTLLVDSTLVSTYANALEFRVRHSIIHSLLFPVRLVHRLALATPLGGMFQSTRPDTEYLHPYVAMLQRVLHLS